MDKSRYGNAPPNLYSYGTNPLNSVDPDGNWDLDLLADNQANAEEKTEGSLIEHTDGVFKVRFHGAYDEANGEKFYVNGGWVGDPDDPKNEILQDYKQIGDRIKAGGWNGKDVIELWVCGAGASGLGQSVADYLHATVKAPYGDVEMGLNVFRQMGDGLPYISVGPKNTEPMSWYKSHGELFKANTPQLQARIQGVLVYRLVFLFSIFFFSCIGTTKKVTIKCDIKADMSVVDSMQISNNMFDKYLMRKTNTNSCLNDYNDLFFSKSCSIRGNSSCIVLYKSLCEYYYKINDSICHKIDSVVLKNEIFQPSTQKTMPH